MSYTPPAYTDALNFALTVYTPLAYTDPLNFELGSASITGTASITLADTTLVATGEVTGAAAPITGEATITLSDTTLSASGDVLVLGSSAITLADTTLVGTGEVTGAAPAITGEATITLADILFTGTGVAPGGESGQPARGIPFWLVQDQINAEYQELQLQEMEIAALAWYYVNNQ